GPRGARRAPRHRPRRPPPGALPPVGRPRLRPRSPGGLMFDIFGRLLVWFYDIAHSYGWSIVLLTVAVRLVLFPLTAKQAKSMQAMQKVQPELKRLQAKYKGDRQKLNEEMMKFYKEHHVNPFGGCIPLFIQFPVLIVLYRLILGLSRTFIVGFTVIVGTAVAVGGAPGSPT